MHFRDLPRLIAGVLAAGTLAAGALSVSPAAAETTLTMANWLPMAHPLMKNAMVPYARSIETATEGRVKVNILPAPLGPPAAHFDFAVNGIADITYGVQGYNPGRFKTKNIAEIPFLGDRAEPISVAYWRVFDKMLRDAGEYDQVKVLGVFTHGPGVIFAKDRNLATMAGIEGAKMRVGGGIVSEIAKALGTVPVEGPSSKTYELLSAGVADGILFPFESVAFFKLIPLLDTALTVPGGLYNTSFFVVMNKAKWESLSEEDKAAIEKVSGEALARLAGKMWDDADDAGRKEMDDKIKILEASDSQVETITDKLDPVVDAKLAEAAETGIDVEAAVEMLMEEIDKESGGE
ncbi:TRAP transporter substrate-binding protein [Rhodobium gokarnense]|uniref:TRAP-type C4-dicarboxylate transport system substrate-binding protein n=1 Tax=Rhodobium gokarnense TaxID=364296 RepID=A0ABT3HGS0_9HYPH|nr:TRAP transporter substrate-binding protein [Rhodobium gokarnense]MCW2309603.1 TRAP-type C4-dicarboxylate transport system substrate-binding protein [Rhodobium gokarnense]